MIPFVRTVTEARRVVELLEENGLKRGENGLRLIMMCEIPSNALLADQFLEYFDGFSIGSNDLTQLTLGLDRDSSLVAESFDERDPAVKALLSAAIRVMPQGEKIRRHLRPGTIRPSRSGALAHGRRDREPLAQSGYGSGNLAIPRKRSKKERSGRESGTDFKTIDLRICSCIAASAPPAPTVVR